MSHHGIDQENRSPLRTTQPGRGRYGLSRGEFMQSPRRALHPPGVTDRVASRGGTTTQQALLAKESDRYRRRPGRRWYLGELFIYRGGRKALSLSSRRPARAGGGCALEGAPR